MWKPDPGWVGLQLVAALALLALVPLVDPVGALLLVPGGLAALGFGLRDLLLSPTLTADAAGLTVVEGVRRTRATWSEVARLRVVTDRRTDLLELDLGDRLVVLSRRRLGAPVDDVLTALQAAQVS